jgi:hypothetical protein
LKEECKKRCKKSKSRLPSYLSNVWCGKSCSTNYQSKNHQLIIIYSFHLVCIKFKFIAEIKRLTLKRVVRKSEIKKSEVTDVVANVVAVVVAVVAVVVDVVVGLMVIHDVDA